MAWPGELSHPPYPAHITRPTPVKRATRISTLLDRSAPWLSWWQELILNWVASWRTVGVLNVSSATTDDYLVWDVPSDLELARLELEELLDVQGHRGEG
jgi:hypothetical protein